MAVFTALRLLVVVEPVDEIQVRLYTSWPCLSLQ